MMESTEKDKEVAEAKKEVIQSDEQLKNIKEEIGVYGDAEAFSKSAGGKKLIMSLESDILDSVLVISVKYKTAAHTELIGLCASLESKLDLLRRMTQAGKKKEEALKSFDERLKEILGE